MMRENTGSFFLFLCKQYQCLKITARQYTYIYLVAFVKRWFFLFTVCAGPGSSAGRSSPANRSHHPAAADCLSFRKQSPRQYAGQHFVYSFFTDLMAVFCTYVVPFFVLIDVYGVR